MGTVTMSSFVNWEPSSKSRSNSPADSPIDGVFVLTTGGTISPRGLECAGTYNMGSGVQGDVSTRALSTRCCTYKCVRIIVGMQGGNGLPGARFRSDSVIS